MRKWIIVEFDVNQVRDEGIERAFGPYDTKEQAEHAAAEMREAPVGYVYFVAPLELLP